MFFLPKRDFLILKRDFLILKRDFLILKRGLFDTQNFWTKKGRIDTLQKGRIDTKKGRIDTHVFYVKKGDFNENISTCRIQRERTCSSK